ncbi:MAG: polymer-forming cytoskeletal protein [Candidatus Aquicultorales bacterium]
MEQRHDLKVAGAMSVAGGKYRNAVVSGAVTINGDLDCSALKVSGAATVNGNVKTGTAKISGVAHFLGDVKAEELRVSGSTSVQGGVCCDRIEIVGDLDIQGDCEAEVFSARGAFDIGGLLNAGRIDVLLYGASKVKEIGGETISIRQERSRIARIIKSLAGLRLLTTDVVEGDDIHLEYVKAKVVRGNNIEVGVGCEIGLVEYRNDYRKVNGAKVKEERKMA